MVPTFYISPNARVSTTKGNYSSTDLSGNSHTWQAYDFSGNTAPTTPSTITKAPSGSTVSTWQNSSISYTWGASTDAEGDTITYLGEIQTNGGSWTQVHNSTTRSYTYTIAAGFNSVNFRVHATRTFTATGNTLSNIDLDNPTITHTLDYAIAQNGRYVFYACDVAGNRAASNAVVIDAIRGPDEPDEGDGGNGSDGNGDSGSSGRPGGSGGGGGSAGSDDPPTVEFSGGFTGPEGPHDTLAPWRSRATPSRASGTVGMLRIILILRGRHRQ